MLLRTATGRNWRRPGPSCRTDGLEDPSDGCGRTVQRRRAGRLAAPDIHYGSGHRVQTRSLFDLAQRQRLPACDGPSAFPRLSAPASTCGPSTLLYRRSAPCRLSKSQYPLTRHQADRRTLQRQQPRHYPIFVTLSYRATSANPRPKDPILFRRQLL